MKSRYANGDCAYRCPCGKICKIIIIVSQQKIQDKSKKKGPVEYTIVSTEKNHTCDNEHNIIKEGNLNNLENNENLVAALIKKNLNNPLSYHIDLIYKAKILLKKRQIKRILQKLRNENWPSDKDFLKDPSFIIK